MGRSSDAKIKIQNEPNHGVVTLTQSGVRVAGAYKPSPILMPWFLLVSQIKVLVEAGCSATIPHGLIVGEDTDVPLMILPVRDQLIMRGYMVEVHMVRPGIPLFTTIYNPTTETRKVYEGDIISSLMPIGIPSVRWVLK